MLEKRRLRDRFLYPVVPHGTARVRTQVSAAQSREDLEFAVKAFCRSERTTETVEAAVSAAQLDITSGTLATTAVDGRNH